MQRVRPIRMEDSEALLRLAHEARYGITNLPKNSQRLKLIHERALQTFAGGSALPYFLFILEEIENNEVLGLAGIYPKSGIEFPLTYLKETKLTLKPLFPEMFLQTTLLEPVKYSEGPTEICSLFLTKTVRQGGLGRLLSFSRFLFMKLFPEKFHSTVFAEMRGWIDDRGDSPFWDALSRRFCPIPYAEFLMRRDNGIDVSQLIPQYPVYSELLDPLAKTLIAATHPNTKPALKILEEQGFKYTGEIDPFDAGPRVMVNREDILTIRKAKRLHIESIAPLSSKPILLSNCQFDFRSCLGPAERRGNGITITSETAHLLEVGIDDEILAVF